ncbi:hypothetical protein R6Q59_010990 [Mikania micrantha]|uniref:DUF4408 domain-containing protein n=1 Tax=Mikania micrantha TaxID=192012 RepID=A0A5N6N4W9_9ASTR|nr:hypothetical protein E3N88_25031 [Mikania micrantha]
MEEESASLMNTTWFTPTLLFIFLNLMIATILFISTLQKHQKPANQNDSHQYKLAGSPSILHRLMSFTLHPHRYQEPSPVTNHHGQQQALEIAATQYVFNHTFDHEHDSHSGSYNNNFDFNLTRFDSDACFNQTNEVTFDNAQTRIDSDPTRVENESLPEQDTDFVETHEEMDKYESLDEVYSKITRGNVNRTKSDTSPASGEVPVRLSAKMKKSASLKSAFSHFQENKIIEARRPASVRERRPPEVDDVEVDSKADDFINRFKNHLKLQRLDSIIRYKDMVNRRGAK